MVTANNDLMGGLAPVQPAICALRSTLVFMSTIKWSHIMREVVVEWMTPE